MIGTTPPKAVGCTICFDLTMQGQAVAELSFEIECTLLGNSEKIMSFDANEADLRVADRICP